MFSLEIFSLRVVEQHHFRQLVPKIKEDFSFFAWIPFMGSLVEGRVVMQKNLETLASRTFH